MITKKNIWIEISKGNYLEVLKSDLVDTIKDNYGWTPLHVLIHPLIKLKMLIVILLFIS